MPGPRKANTHRDKQITAQHRTHCEALNLPCAICGQAIDYELPPSDRNAFQSDHIESVKLRPDLEFEPANRQPSHRRCNASKGAKQAPRDIGATTIQW